MEEKGEAKQIQDVSEQMKIRLEKLEQLRKDGRDPFVQTNYQVTAQAQKIVNEFENFEGKVVSLAGRMMSKRGMGKASFVDLQDCSGKIQCYFQVDSLGKEPYAVFKKWDIGDIIGVTGEVFRTHRGEISVKISEAVMLSKALLPLPEKWHGLRDTDLRYRQRYLDLIVNPSVKETFVKRSRILSEIRRFLENEAFLEVETPVLHNMAGGAAARPFATHHNALNLDMYLRIALELHLKRLIVGGFDRVFEIGRVFRNEGTDTKHNPEFTLLELYQAYTDIHGMMEITEKMIQTVAQNVLETQQIDCADVTIDLSKPFERITMLDSVKKYAGVDFSQITSLEQARNVADEHKIAYESRHKIGDILNLFFDKYVEENLIQPTFITDYPIEISPLAKKKKDNPALTERFELFIVGREFANAFSELNDPIDQRQRFEAQMELRRQGDEEAAQVDEDFLNALSYGMPPTGGMGMGIDRLVMLLTGNDCIRDVLLFPTMKTLNDVNKKNDVKSKAAEEVKAEPEKIDFSKVKIEPLFEEAVDFDTFSKSDFRAVKVKECVAVPKSKKLLQFTLDDGTGTDRTILSGIHAYYEPEELVGKTLIAITNLPPRAMMGIDSCGMLLSAIHEEEGKEKLHLLMVDDHIPAGAKLY